MGAFLPRAGNLEVMVLLSGAYAFEPVIATPYRPRLKPHRLRCVSDPGWKAAKLSEVPSRSELPGVSVEGYLEAMRERAPHILERWADAQKSFRGEHRKTHDVRGFLGVESFGVNAFQAHEGELLIVPHDELGEGEQQE